MVDFNGMGITSSGKEWYCHNGLASIVEFVNGKVKVTIEVCIMKVGEQ